MPPAPPARRTPKATPPADDATVVVTFKGRKNCADTSVPITLVKHKEKWASHAYCPEELRGKRVTGRHGERDRRKVSGLGPSFDV